MCTRLQEIIGIKQTNIENKMLISCFSFEPHVEMKLTYRGIHNDYKKVWNRTKEAR